MAIIWEAQDQRGRTVTFQDDAWSPILARHSDFSISTDDIREVIENAAEIVRDRTFRRREIHYRLYQSGPLWLRVVVNYRPHQAHGWVGDVTPAHVIRKRKEIEELLWQLSEHE